jgi:CheY-like chemotaxis protein
MARILCIDDNQHGCWVRQSLLEGQGHTVATARSGKEGLEKFRAEKFDLVVVDYLMPGMNGGEVIAKIRETHPRLPIILHSGFTDRLALERKVTQADALLQKGGPREIKELLETVSRLLYRPARKPAARVQAHKRKGRAASC